MVPAFTLGYRVNKKLVVGFATYSPFGLSTDYDKFSAVQADARESDLLTIIMGLVVAYDVVGNRAAGVGLNGL